MRISFSEINLSELDLLRLKIASASNAILLDSGEEKILVELGFIEQNSCFNTTHHYSITPDGKLYLTYLEKKERFEILEQDKWICENRREWIGIALSGGTAIISLIIAAISLAWQVLSQSGPGC